MFIALSICVVGSLFFAGAVHAEGAAGAVVIKNEGPCAMLGADENGEPVTDMKNLGTQTLKVENKSRVLLKCKGTGVQNDSGSGQAFRGFECAVPVPSLDGEVRLTRDSHATISASGVATLTCTYSK